MHTTATQKLTTVQNSITCMFTRSGELSSFFCICIPHGFVFLNIVCPRGISTDFRVSPLPTTNKAQQRENNDKKQKVIILPQRLLDTV